VHLFSTRRLDDYPAASAVGVTALLKLLLGSLIIVRNGGG
jgi:hypothetical protein